MVSGKLGEEGGVVGGQAIGVVLGRLDKRGSKAPGGGRWMDWGRARV